MPIKAHELRAAPAIAQAGLLPEITRRVLRVPAKYLIIHANVRSPAREHQPENTDCERLSKAARSRAHALCAAAANPFTALVLPLSHSDDFHSPCLQAAVENANKISRKCPLPAALASTSRQLVLSGNRLC